MPYISINAIEGPVDTTRTMVSLLFQGGAAKYPDIRWIFSHSGGVTPFLLSRFEREEVEKDRKSVLPNGVMYELRKFYYDTAQGHHEGALKGTAHDHSRLRRCSMAPTIRSGMAGR